MKKIIRHTILSALLPIFCIGICSADSQAPGQYLLNQMNQVRQSPYERAVCLGYSPEYLRTINIFPETVLPEIKENFFLQKRAEAEFFQEFSMDAENHIRPELSEKEGSGSLAEPEYMNSANTSAVISFLNYMPLERACDIFISHILRKELDSGQKKALLSKEITRAGIVAASGITGQGSNAWFFSFHLGGGPFLQEMQALNLINQIRACPKALAAFTKKGLFPGMEKDPRVSAILPASYPPVFLDSDLYGFLQSVQDSDNLHGEYPDFHFFHYDFTNLSAKNPLETSDPTVSVSQMFTELIDQEFLVPPSEQLIFSRQFSLVTPKIQFSREDGRIQGMLIAAQKRSPVAETDSELPAMAHLYILAFADSNEDGLYSPGEEYTGLRFKVFDSQNHVVQSFKTDRAGHRTVQLPMFQKYTFRIEYTPNHIIEREVFLMKDQFLSFILPGFRNPGFRDPRY